MSTTFTTERLITILLSVNGTAIDNDGGKPGAYLAEVCRQAGHALAALVEKEFVLTEKVDHWKGYALRVEKASNDLRFEMKAKEDELAEHKALFDLRWQADQRGIELWRAAAPGRELKAPDHADMVSWLLEERGRLLAENAKLISDVKTAVWSDSEECKMLTAEVERLRDGIRGIKDAAVKGEMRTFAACVKAHDAMERIADQLLSGQAVAPPEPAARTKVLVIRNEETDRPRNTKGASEADIVITEAGRVVKNRLGPTTADLEAERDRLISAIQNLGRDSGDARERMRWAIRERNRVIQDFRNLRELVENALATEVDYRKGKGAGWFGDPLTDAFDLLNAFLARVDATRRDVPQPDDFAEAIETAIRTFSSPTTGRGDVHGGQAGHIVYERDGLPFIVAQLSMWKAKDDLKQWRRERELAGALIRAAGWFETYAENHRAKGATEKEMVNAERATLCRAAAEGTNRAGPDAVTLLAELVRGLLDNDPNEAAADNGVSVIDVWRADARRVLTALGLNEPAATAGDAKGDDQKPPCPHCHGQKTVEASRIGRTLWVRCEHCRGTGRFGGCFSGPGWPDCPSCQGAGEVPMPGGVVAPCNDCHASGKARDGSASELARRALELED